MRYEGGGVKYGQKVRYVIFAQPDMESLKLKVPVLMAFISFCLKGTEAVNITYYVWSLGYVLYDITSIRMFYMLC